MKTRFALPLIAGAAALALAGCSSFHRNGDRMSDRTVEPAGYVGQAGTTGIPPSIDPFSASYVPFPIQATDQPMTSHSMYCSLHYSQPGCQTFDTNDRMARNDHMFRRSHREEMRDREGRRD